MSLSLTINGIVYQYPETGDVEWGPDATDWAVAVTAGMLQKAGGAFTLTADVDFGATYGLKSTYYKSRAAAPSSTGQVRLGNTEFIGWRNFAGDGDMELAVNVSDQLTYNGNPIIPSTALTASKAVVTDASGVLTTASPSTTEVNYLVGVSALIQTQLDGKQPTGSYITALTGDGTASGPGSAVFTIGANKVLDTMIRQSAGLSVVGRSANTTGNVADITAGTDGFVLRRSGTTLDFGLLLNANIDAAAAIAFSKLATLTSGNLLIGSAGNVATSTAMSGDTTISSTGVVAIGANKVTLAMLAQVATPSFLGRTSASTGNVESLTVTQATAMLNDFGGDLGSGGTKGLVPAPAAGDAAALKFLKADGTWAAPSGAGDVVGPSSAHDGGLVLFNGTTGKLIKESTITQHNVLTSGANGTVNSVAPSTAYKRLASDGTDFISTFQEAEALGSLGAGTTTRTISDNPNAFMTLSAARTYVLPTTSVPTGYVTTIINLGDFALTIQSSDGDTVCTLNVGTVTIRSNQATPTDKTHWIIEYIRSKNTTSTTFTFNGSGGTSGSTAIILERLNNFVYMQLPTFNATTGTSSTVATANTAIPTAFRPNLDYAVPCNGIRNNAAALNSAGIVFVNASGVVQLARDATITAFTNSASAGLQLEWTGQYYSPIP